MSRNFEMRRKKNLDVFHEVDEINWKDYSNAINTTSQDEPDGKEDLSDNSLYKEMMEEIDMEESGGTTGENTGLLEELEELDREENGGTTVENTGLLEELEELDREESGGTTVENTGLLEELEELDREENGGITGETTSLLEELEKIENTELWNAVDLGKYTINTPAQEKKKAEEQDQYMDPVSELGFQKISDDVSEEDKRFQDSKSRLLREMGAIKDE